MRLILAAAALAAGAGLLLAVPGPDAPAAGVSGLDSAFAAGPAAAGSVVAADTASAGRVSAALGPFGVGLPAVRPHTVHAHRIGWRWPLDVPTGAARPTVVRGFEPPSQRWKAGHRGVDLLATVGQRVRAAGAGTVSYAGVLFGRPVVAVDHTSPGHDTLRTTYEPVDPAVRVGDRVHAGQEIGTIAAGAVDPQVGHCPPQACLHWGAVRGFGHAERYQDPIALLDRRGVRLLPVWSRR